MRTSVTKIVSFDAAHSLPHHEGKCRGLHGHSYRLEVTVAGGVEDQGPSAGMVLDFAALQAILVETVVEPLDHTYLNEVLEVVPTAESIAAWAFESLRARGLNVVRVRLWESPTSYAEVEA
jgi:6-pyruvoyltetrahydropterin/6-carboxytetrahydropterin synthase